jgi:hypothetical protein
MVFDPLLPPLVTNGNRGWYDAEHDEEEQWVFLALVPNDDTDAFKSKRGRKVVKRNFMGGKVSILWVARLSLLSLRMTIARTQSGRAESE